MSKCDGDRTLSGDHHDLIQFEGTTCPLCRARRRDRDLCKYVANTVEFLSSQLGEDVDEAIKVALETLGEEVEQ